MSSTPVWLDVLNRRERVVQRWLSHLGQPYRWGTMDCSHLVWSGHRDAGTWPIEGDSGYRTVGQMWVMPELIHVSWEERQPADIVFFGDENGLAHHVVGVVDLFTMVGANGGGAPLKGETFEQYAAREAAAGAKVKTVGPQYWASHRLGVRRVPSLHIPAFGPPAPAA